MWCIGCSKQACGGLRCVGCSKQVHQPQRLLLGLPSLPIPLLPVCPPTPLACFVCIGCDELLASIVRIPAEPLKCQLTLGAAAAAVRAMVARLWTLSTAPPPSHHHTLPHLCVPGRARWTR
eukprot:38337-Chlamydomonas_euryale.AAC.12